MTKKLRLITGLLAAVLAAVMLSSAVYIAVEANHNCSGEDCAICHQLQVCENLLKSIGLAGAAAVFAAAVRYALTQSYAGKMVVTTFNLPAFPASFGFPQPARTPASIISTSSSAVIFFIDYMYLQIMIRT